MAMAAKAIGGRHAGAHNFIGIGLVATRGKLVPKAKSPGEARR